MCGAGVLLIITIIILTTPALLPPHDKNLCDYAHTVLGGHFKYREQFGMFKRSHFVKGDPHRAGPEKKHLGRKKEIWADKKGGNTFKSATCLHQVKAGRSPPLQPDTFRQVDVVPPRSTADPDKQRKPRSYRNHAAHLRGLH